MTGSEPTRPTIPPSVLVLATGNPHKVQELTRLLAALAIPLQSLADYPAVQAIAEDGSTLAENARKKAAGYARQLCAWVLADDTGLEVDALQGAPGIHSSRYAGEGATMKQNRIKLLEALSDVPPPQRAARFVCQLAVADPAGEIVAEAQGYCPGAILRQPSAGACGFGYDVLFQVDGTSLTLAEMNPEQTARWGHRGRAVRELLKRWPLASLGRG